jgi:hypothetical protein
MKGQTLNRIPRAIATCLALAACLGAASAALAQEVHKCTQGGHVTYQATPCPGDDKVLPIRGGPDVEDVEAARQRAATQKARAREAAPPATGSAPAAASAPVPGASAPRDAARPANSRV